MRKLLLTIWVTSLAALLALLGYIGLHGTTEHRTSLAEDLGIISVGTFIAWAVLSWKAKQ